jgi:hypothetical protein
MSFHVKTQKMDAKDIQTDNLTKLNADKLGKLDALALNISL